MSAGLATHVVAKASEEAEQLTFSKNIIRNQGIRGNTANTQIVTSVKHYYQFL